jgi:hypothetical protein
MMRFGWVDPWPEAVEIRFDGEGSGVAAAGDVPDAPDMPGVPAGPGGGAAAGEGGQGLPDVRDARPFGGGSLRGLAGAEALGDLLESYARRLRGGPRALRGDWETVGGGLAFSEARALYGARFGPPAILVAKADPALWELAPYFAGEGGTPPAGGGRSLRDWAWGIPGAALVVNGGQFYADRTSMGRLVRGGAEIEPRAHPRWKGFLSSGPAAPGVRPFAVADGEMMRAGEDPALYRNVLQTYMAVDRLGGVRVASSDRLASRTAVGEDAEGRICVVLFPGAMTLYDMALVLSDLEIYPAASLDGGFETQMALRRGGVWSFYYGEYSHNALGNVWVEEYRPPLYLVAALVPAPRLAEEAGEGDGGGPPGDGAAR